MAICLTCSSFPLLQTTVLIATFLLFGRRVVNGPSAIHTGPWDHFPHHNSTAPACGANTVTEWDAASLPLPKGKPKGKASYEPNWSFLLSACGASEPDNAVPSPGHWSLSCYPFAGPTSFPGLNYAFETAGVKAKYYVAQTPIDMKSALQDILSSNHPRRLVILNIGLWPIAGRAHNLRMKKLFPQFREDAIPAFTLQGFMSDMRNVFAELMPLLRKAPPCTVFWRELFAVQYSQTPEVFDRTSSNRNLMSINAEMAKLLEKVPNVGTIPGFGFSLLPCCEYYDAIHPSVNCNTLMLRRLLAPLMQCCRHSRVGAMGNFTGFAEPIREVIFVGDSTSRAMFGALAWELIRNPSFFDLPAVPPPGVPFHASMCPSLAKEPLPRLETYLTPAFFIKSAAAAARATRKGSAPR
eukprot:RCo015245